MMLPNPDTSKPTLSASSISATTDEYVHHDCKSVQSLLAVVSPNVEILILPSCFLLSLLVLGILSLISFIFNKFAH